MKKNDNYPLVLTGPGRDYAPDGTIRQYRVIHIHEYTCVVRYDNGETQTSSLADKQTINNDIRKERFMLRPIPETEEVKQEETEASVSEAPTEVPKERKKRSPNKPRIRIAPAPPVLDPTVDLTRTETVLLEGDCLEQMREIADHSVATAYIGLPYQTTKHSWDIKIDLAKMWPELKRIVKPGGAMCFLTTGILTAELMMSNKADYRYKITWIKQEHTGCYANGTTPAKHMYEEVVVFRNGKDEEGHDRFFRYNEIKYQGDPREEWWADDDATVGSRYGNARSGTYGNEDGSLHPVDVLFGSNRDDYYWEQRNRMKLLPPGEEFDLARSVTNNPLWLAMYLIKTFSNPGDTVLDITMGLGTTGVAAVNLGRKFIGIEMNRTVLMCAREFIDAAGPGEHFEYWNLLVFQTNSFMQPAPLRKQILTYEDTLVEYDLLAKPVEADPKKLGYESYAEEKTEEEPEEPEDKAAAAGSGK